MPVTVAGPWFWIRAAGLVARRPRLWWAALRQWVRLSPPGWWRRPPFVPRPDPTYLRYRFDTAYGPRGRADPRDVVHYLAWCAAGRR